MVKNDEGKLYHMLGRIEATLESIEKLLKTANDNHKTLEGRVSKVEQKQWFVSGIFATLGTYAGYLFGKGA